ncbi:MAG: acyl-CoA dehydrogenase family protein, partial [Candidatus Baltobacteraceae bacterium]
MTDRSAAARFEITDEQRQIAALAREFAQKEIAPYIAAWDREHYFPRQLYTK